MSSVKVYLAGTISKDEKHLEWRKRARTVLDGLEVSPGEFITTVDPVRFQDPSNFERDGLHDSTIPSRVFVARDIRDVLDSHAIFAVYYQETGLTKERRQSIGTWMELFGAHMHSIPSVLVTDDPDVRDHPFSEYCVTHVCRNLEDGLKMLKLVLGIAPTSVV